MQLYSQEQIIIMEVMKGMKKNNRYNDATGFNVYARIKDLCKQYSITPYRISEDSGIGSGTISKWKNGDIKNISLQAIEDVCFAIGITLHYFFNDDLDEEQDRELEEVQSIYAIGAGTVSKKVFTDGSNRIERCDTHKDLSLYLSDIEAMIERKRKLFGEDK